MAHMARSLDIAREGVLESDEVTSLLDLSEYLIEQQRNYQALPHVLRALELAERV